MFNYLIGNLYKIGWNRAAEPYNEPNECEHCYSTNNTTYPLSKSVCDDVNTSSSIVVNTKIWHCNDCGNEKQEVKVRKPRKQLDKANKNIRLFAKLTQKQQDELLSLATWRIK